jgi:5-methylcytosine-specific restriction protein B
LIAAVLAHVGRTSKVATLRDHPWVVAKIRQRGRNPGSASSTLWAYLQSHTPPDNPNVAYSQRRAPYIFTKDVNSDWSLVADWRELDEEADALERVLAAGPTAVRDSIRRYRIVTFHPSFTYEEFIRGIRPVQREEDETTQFQVVDGVFKLACDEARANPSKRYAFFIDEINRANIAKVFGELITLVEPDKRAVYDSEGRLTSGMEVHLPGSESSDVADPPFGVPANLDIYGTMNTADRSIALLDIALRRRFEFQEMEPEYELIKERVPGVSLQGLLRRINDRLEYFLDRDHRIGHAYLMSVQHLTDLRRAFRLKIIPLLQEYFFDDLSRVAAVLATAPTAAPFVKRETVAYSQLFAGTRIEGVPAEQYRYVVMPEPSWTEASFAGVYESASTQPEDEGSGEL